MVSMARQYGRKNTTGYRSYTGVGIQLGIRINVCLVFHVDRFTYLLNT